MFTIEYIPTESIPTERESIKVVTRFASSSDFTQFVVDVYGPEEYKDVPLTIPPVFSNWHNIEKLAAQHSITGVGDSKWSTPVETLLRLANIHATEYIFKIITAQKLRAEGTVHLTDLPNRSYEYQPLEDGILAIGTQIYELKAVGGQFEEHYRRRQSALVDTLHSSLRDRESTIVRQQAIIDELSEHNVWRPEIDIRHIKAGVQMLWYETGTYLFLPFDLNIRRVSWGDKIWNLKEEFCHAVQGLVCMGFTNRRVRTNIAYLHRDMTCMRLPHSFAASTPTFRSSSCLGNHEVGAINDLDDFVREATSVVKTQQTINTASPAQANCWPGSAQMILSFDPSIYATGEVPFG